MEELERMRTAVAQRDALLQLVIDALPVGVAVVDANGDLLLANPATRAIWGHMIPSGDERWRLSRGWWHGTGARVEPHEWASLRALLEGRPQLDQLIDIEGFDGSRRTIRNSSVPIMSAQGIEGAVILMEDVTDKLRLQEQLAQARQLESLGRLASGVAHDFNNLLMIITSYADLVRATLPPTDARLADLGEIFQAVESATGLTRQLLAFGKRDAFRPRDVVLEPVVAGLRTMLARVIGANIKIEIDLAEPAHHVLMDPVHLQQIVVNLALNARDAMPSGGLLTLSTHAAAHGVVVLRVRDTGTGMDEATQARIFEPFFTTKERGRGSGLGLATVYGLVEQSGGKIRVSSLVGRGTLFEIELPSHTPTPEPVVEPAIAPSTPPVGGDKTVLLVEDSPPLRLAVRAMLERAGYRVHDVASAEAAAAYVAGGGTMDLLLTDLMLTGRSGRALADELCAAQPDLRVLFMSGYPDDDALNGTGHPALAKPFSAETLDLAIRAALA